VVDYCDLDDIKNRLAGDGINMSADYDGTIRDKCTEVSADIDRMVAQARGQTAPWSFLADDTASERLFQAKPGNALLLPIDDCVEVTVVTLYSAPGIVSRVLVPVTDYLPIPLQGSPIIALKRASGWPAYPGLTGVTSRWGYADAIGADVRKATIIEVIRSYLGDRSGNDDRIGMTPFGSIITAKAYTSLVRQLISDYSRATGGLQ
jgi:hypothetical protein